VNNNGYNKPVVYPLYVSMTHLGGYYYSVQRIVNYNLETISSKGLETFINHLTIYSKTRRWKKCLRNLNTGNHQKMVCGIFI